MKIGKNSTTAHNAYNQVGGKKRSTIKLVSIVLLITIVLGCFFVLYACRSNLEIYEVEDSFVTVSLPAPTDGSLPTQHSPLENVAYLNYTFAKQTNYYAQTSGTTISVGIRQMVDAHKQYNNGVLIVADITSSSLIKKARQYCYVGNEVMWRSASNNNFDGLNTAWRSELEGHVAVEDFKDNYGLPATEFSAYVINQDTLIDASEVVQNADGTFSQTYNLSTTKQTGAGAYYAKQMVFAGGLDDYPDFLHITVTYTFDKDWRILATDVDEAYMAKMGISVECKSNFRTTYQYDTDQSQSSAYDDFFKEYVGDVDVFVPVEKTVEAVGCLGEAFGCVLAQPTIFDVSVQIDDKLLVGSVYVDVTTLLGGGDIDDLVVRADFGNIALWLQDGQAYLMYNGLKVTFTFDELVSLVKDLLGEQTPDVSGIDMDELLASLGNGTFEYLSKQSANLSSVLPLLGLDIPVEFAFLLDENNNASLKDVNATLKVANMDVKVNLSFGNKAIDKLTDEQKTTFAKVVPYVDTISDILSDEALALGVDLTVGDVRLQGNVNLALSGLELSTSCVNVDGNLDVTYKQSRKKVKFALQNGVVLMDVDGLKVKANLQDAIAYVGDLLHLQPSTLQVAKDNGIDISSLVAVLLDGSFAENIQISEKDNALDILLQTKELLGTLGLTLNGFDVGEVALQVNNNSNQIVLCANKVDVESFGCLGVQLTAQKGELPTQVDESIYVDLLELAKPLVEIFTSENIGGTIRYSAQEFTVDCNYILTLDKLQVSANLVFTYKDICKNATLHFDGDVIFAQIDELKVQITTQDVADLVALLVGDIPQLTSEQTDLVEKILSIDFSQFVALSQTITDGATSSVIALNGTEILKLLGVDFALGKVNITVENDTLSANALGVDVTIAASEQGVELLTKEEKQGYLYVTPIVYKVLDIVNDKALSLAGKVTLDIDDTCVVLDLQRANVSWANGIEVELCGQLYVQNVYFNITLFANEQRVKVAFGQPGVELAYDEFATLETALVKIYNDIYDVVGEMSTTEQNPLPQIDGIGDLVALLQGSVAVSKTGNVLTELLGNGDIDAILSQLQIANTHNGIVVTLGDLVAQLTSLEGSAFALTLQGALQGVNVDVVANVDFAFERVDCPQITYLTASDFVETFDYLSAVVNTLLQQDLSLQATIVTNTTDESYSNGRKKQIDVKADFHSGDVVPLHFNLDTKSLYLSTNLYLHLNLAVKDFEQVEGNDIYLDIWLYNESGKEYLQAVAQVSKFESTDSRYKPLALTASADQLMSVLSSALSLVGLNDGFVNDWVVSKWLSCTTAQQLEAIGASLFETINLDDLLAGVVGDTNQQPQDVCLDKVLQLILQKDESGNYNGCFNVTIDGELLFGNDASDLVVTLTKVSTENGSLLQAVSVDNVAISGGESLYVELVVDYAPVDVVAPVVDVNATVYHADGLKELFEVLANSVTHNATESDVAKGFANSVGDYTINRNFLVDGKAYLDLQLVGLNVADIVVDVVLSVSLDDNGQVAINIRLQYEHLTKLGIVAINGDTVLDVTIKGNMMYMKRTQTSDANGKALASPEIIYRALPVATIASNTQDLISHIAFMFNLGDFVTNTIKDNITESTTSSAPQVADFGTQAYNVLSGYGYANGSWKVSLNGGALTGNVLTDIVLDLGADENNVLRSLGLSTAIATSGVNVAIQANLAYRNAQNVMDSDAVDNTTDISSILESAMSKKIAQMNAINWTDENGKALFIQGKLSTINYFVKGEWVASQDIVMDVDTLEMFADFAHPNIDAYAEKGYTLKWSEMDSSLQVNALYTPNEYAIHFQSDIAIPNWDNDGLSMDTTYLYGTNFNLPFTQNLSHKIVYFVDQMGNVYKTSQDMQIVFADTTLTAVWEQIDYTVTFTDGNEFSESFTLHYGEPLPQVTAPQKVGYTFANWDTTGNVVGDMNILANYTPNTYKVTLVSDFEMDGFVLGDDGKYAMVVDFVYDTKVDLPQNVTYNQTYVLNGFKAENSEQVYIYTIPNVMQDTTLCAIWEVIGINVLFRQEDGSVTTINKPVGTYIALEQMPEIANKVGCTGAWAQNGEKLVDGYQVTTTDNVVLEVVYTANTYAVTLVSQFACDGFTQGASGYTRQIAYTYDENATAVDLGSVADIPSYWFGGYYSQPNGNGELANHTTAVASDTTYYAYWQDNTVTVRYYSDVKLENTTFDVGANGYYIEKTYNDVYAVDYQPVLAGYQRLGGWWQDNGETFVQVTDVRAFHGQTDVKLWALWIQEISISITEFYTNSVVGGAQYNIGGQVTGGQPAPGMSSAIYTSANIQRSASASFYIYNEKGQKEDNCGAGKSVDVVYQGNSNVGTFLRQGMNSANYSGLLGVSKASHGGAIMTMVFTVGSDTISTTNSAFVSMESYTVTIKDGQDNVIKTVGNLHTGSLRDANTSTLQLNATSPFVSTYLDDVSFDQLQGKTMIGYKVNGTFYTFEQIEQLRLMGNTEIDAVYLANLYTVTFTNSYQLDESWTLNSQTSLYEKTLDMRYGSDVTFLLVDGSKVNYTVSDGQNVFALPTLVQGNVWGTFAPNENGFTVVEKDGSDLVTLSSIVAFDYNDGANSLVGAQNATLKFSSDYALVSPTAEGFTFIGWYKEQAGNFVRVTNLAFSNGEMQHVTLKALWASNISVVIDGASKSGFIGYSYKGTVVTTGGKLVGIDGLSVTSVTLDYRFWAKSTEGYQASGGNSHTYDSYDGVRYAYAMSVSSTKQSRVHAFVTLKYVINGETFYVDDGNPTNTGDKVGAYANASV